MVEVKIFFFSKKEQNIYIYYERVVIYYFTNYNFKGDQSSLAFLSLQEGMLLAK